MRGPAVAWTGRASERQRQRRGRAPVSRGSSTAALRSDERSSSLIHTAHLRPRSPTTRAMGAAPAGYAGLRAGTRRRSWPRRCAAPALRRIQSVVATLTKERLRWGLQGDGLGSRGAAADAFAGSSAGRRGWSIGSASGRRSRVGCRVRTRRWRRACRSRSARGGSARVAGCRRSRWLRSSGRYLSFAEREEIALLHAQGAGVREIARRLGRSPSTISRELRRNAATRSGGLEYRATTAQWHAERRRRRPKVAKLAANDRLRRYVQDRLAGRDHRARRDARSAGPTVRVERSPPRPPPGPALGDVVEPGADRRAAAARLPR